MAGSFIPLPWDDLVTTQPFQALTPEMKQQTEHRYFKKFGKEEAARQFEKLGLPPLLGESMVMRESSGDPLARSNADAYGLLQLRPDAAADVGANRTIPSQNVAGGAAYLRRQLDTFGDLPKAIAAYHAGPGNVQEALDAAGDGWFDYLGERNPTTRQYVEGLLGDIGGEAQAVTPALTSEQALAELSQRLFPPKPEPAPFKPLSWDELITTKPFQALSPEKQQDVHQRFLAKYPDDQTALTPDILHGGTLGALPAAQPAVAASPAPSVLDQVLGALGGMGQEPPTVGQVAPVAGQELPLMGQMPGAPLQQQIMGAPSSPVSLPPIVAPDFVQAMTQNQQPSALTIPQIVRGLNQAVPRIRQEQEGPGLQDVPLPPEGLRQQPPASMGEVISNAILNLLGGQTQQEQQGAQRGEAFLQQAAKEQGTTPQAIREEVFTGKPSVPERAVMGIKRGAIGTIKSGLDFLPMVEDLAGVETPIGQFGKEAADRLESSLSQLSPAQPTFFDDLAGVVGSMSTLFVPGLGAQAIAAKIAQASPKVAAWTGAGLSAMTEAWSEAGAAYDTLLEKGIAPPNAASEGNRVFWKNLLLVGASNKAGLFSEGGTALTKGVKTAGQEGMQEGAQERIQQEAEGKPWGKESLKDIGKAAALGGIAGGAVGGVTGMLENRPPKEERGLPKIEPMPAEAPAGPTEMGAAPEAETAPPGPTETGPTPDAQEEPIIMGDESASAETKPSPAETTPPPTGTTPPVAETPPPLPESGLTILEEYAQNVLAGKTPLEGSAKKMMQQATGSTASGKKLAQEFLEWRQKPAEATSAPAPQAEVETPASTEPETIDVSAWFKKPEYYNTDPTGGFGEGVDIQQAGQGLRQKVDAALDAGLHATLVTDGGKEVVLHKGLMDEKGAYWGPTAMAMSGYTIRIEPVEKAPPPPMPKPGPPQQAPVPQPAVGTGAAITPPAPVVGQGATISAPAPTVGKGGTVSTAPPTVGPGGTVSFPSPTPGSPQRKPVAEIPVLQASKGELTPETIHAAADKASIPWDDDPAFMAWSKELTGTDKLDEMDQDQLTRMETAIERGEKPTLQQEEPPNANEIGQPEEVSAQPGTGSSQEIRGTHPKRQEASREGPASEKVARKKETWELTRGEFLKQHVDELVASGMSQANAEDFGVTDITTNGIVYGPNKSHADAVNTALREGKLVPPEVLADYPDLPSKAGPPPVPLPPVSAPPAPEGATPPPPGAVPNPIEAALEKIASGDAPFGSKAAKEMARKAVGKTVNGRPVQQLSDKALAKAYLAKIREGEGEAPPPASFKIGDEVTPTPGSGLSAKNGGKITHIGSNGDLKTEGSGRLSFPSSDFVKAPPRDRAPKAAPPPPKTGGIIEQIRSAGTFAKGSHVVYTGPSHPHLTPGTIYEVGGQQRGRVLIHAIGDSTLSIPVGTRLIHETSSSPAAPPPTETPPPAPEVEAPTPEWGANNKIVTRDRVAEIRARLLKKLDQVNVGVDPEMMTLGAELAVFHIEAGARSFVDFTRAVIGDLGEKARPYLKFWYISARNWPGMDKTGMQTEAELDALPEEESVPVAQEETPLTEPPTPTDPVTASQTVADWVKSQLESKSPFTNQDLFDEADIAFGGTQGQGIYTAKDASDAMEMGINRYLRMVPMGSVTSAQETVDTLNSLLRLLPTQSRRSAEQEEFQQFSTPPTEAFVAAWVADITSDDVVLEPSAGLGSLATFAQNTGAEVIVNELSPRRAALLQQMNFDRVFTENAEQLHNILPADVQPTVVLMNPPFSSTAGRIKGQRKTSNAIAHVEQALKRLQPNGRLVAIVGQGMNDAAPTFRDWWKKIKGEYNVRANISVPGAEYAKYGTTFGNQIVVIDKTGPTPVGGTRTGSPASLREVVPLLEGIRNDRPEVTQGGEQPTSEPTRETAPEPDRGEAGREQPVPPPADDLGSGERNGETGAEDTGRSDGVPGDAVGTLPEENAQVSAGMGEERGGGEPDRGADPSGGGRGEFSKGAPASAALSNDGTERPVDGGVAESEPEELTESVYESYRPAKLQVTGARPHVSPLVQSAAMASVDPPAITYTPTLPQEMITSGKISDAQLEAVTYAGQAHERVLPNGQRQGFFVGDGTGVGKGRTNAAIIADNWAQGRPKAMWISANNKLLQDATRDVAGIGDDPKKLFPLSGVNVNGAITRPEGILFATYATLGKTAQPDKKTGEPGKKRMDQIVEWAGEDFEGTIIFDESHALANALSDEGGAGRRGKAASQQALAGVALQRRLPKARIVYVSATGATEVRNLAYAERLGLWGEGTPFADVRDFTNKISAGGLAAMELVARDMKAKGLYLARSLSFDGVTYETLEHPLTDDQREIYNVLARAWRTVLQNINQALELTEAKKNSQAKANAMNMFWSGHQRFFNQVLTSLQMPSVLTRIRQDLDNGDAIVLQLVNTLQAAQNRKIAELEEAEDEEGQGLESLDLTPREGLMDLVHRGFPTQQYEEYEDDNGNRLSRPVLDSKGEPVENPEAVTMREALLDQLGAVRVPEGPLDILFNTFGEAQVAEVTGRSQRVLRIPEGKVIKQALSTKKMLVDAKAFMDDKKRLLIFSNAGGTGQSYHADLGVPNQRKRRHYLIQPGWQADRAVQGMGRTHRTNEKEPPHYVLVTTDVKGQKRFISSIARRLDQLGSLTKGQRQTGSQGLFSARDNLESQYATDALRRFWVDLHRHQIEGLNFRDVATQMGLLGKLIDRHGRLTQDLPPITQFLNRVLSLDLETQSAVFDAFSERMDQNIARAIAENSLDIGMENLKAKSARLVKEQPVYTDPQSGAQTNHVELELTHDRKFTRFETARQKGGLLGFYRNPTSQRLSALYPAAARTTEAGAIEQRYVSTSPTSTQAMNETDFAKLEVVDEKEAKAAWNAVIADASPTYTTQAHLLTGALLPIWDRLTGNVRVVRTQTTDGKRYLGRLINEDDIDATLDNLGVTAPLPEVTPTDLITQVVENNASVDLVNGWTIKRSRVGGEPRLEIIGPDYREQAALVDQGAFTERIQYVTRTFLPTGDQAEAVLGRVLASRPVKRVRSPQQSAADILQARTNESGFIASDILTAPARAAMAAGQFAKRTMGNRSVELESLLGGGRGEEAFDETQWTQGRIATQQAEVIETMGDLFTHKPMMKILTRVFGQRHATTLSRFFRSFEAIAKRFGIPASRQEKLFEAAESIKEFSGNTPTFGTRIFEKDPDTKQLVRDQYGQPIMKEWRYTPQQGADFWKDLNDQEKTAVQYWVEMRDVMKQVFNVSGEIEGYVHHFWHQGFFEGLGHMMGRHTRLKKKTAGTRLGRKDEEGKGFSTDFERSIIKVWSDLIVEKEWNDMMKRLVPLVTDPIGPAGVKEGWELIPKTQPTRRGQFIGQIAGGRQIPKQLYDEMVRWGEPVKEASAVAGAARSIGSYMAANLMLHPGTMVNNALGSGLQYASFLLDSAAKGAISGEWKPFLDASIAPFLALLPSYNTVFTPELLGSHSNMVTQFKSHGPIDTFFNALLTPIGAVDNYVKRSTAIAIARSLHLPVSQADILANRKAYAAMRQAVDQVGLDYGNVNSRLEKFRASPYGRYFSLFATYPYKMMQHMGHYLSALNPGAKMEPDPRFHFNATALAKLGLTPEHLERISRLIVLGTIYSLLQALFPEDEEKVGKRLSGMGMGLDRTARVKIGETPEGKERYWSPSGHPWFAPFLAVRSLQKWAKKSESPTDELWALAASTSPSGGPFFAAYEAWQQSAKDPDRYPLGPAVARMAKPLVPGGRIAESIRRQGPGPELRSTSFTQELVEAAPFPIPDEWIGARQIIIDPVTKEPVLRNPSLEQKKFWAGWNIREIDPPTYDDIRDQITNRIMERLDRSQNVQEFDRAMSQLKEANYDTWLELSKQVKNDRILIEKEQFEMIQQLEDEQREMAAP